MNFPKREIVDMVKKHYPYGTRVALEKMDDPYAPPIGMKGTVIGVDDTASLIMHWDNGNGLNVIYGVDSVRKISEQQTKENINNEIY